MLRLLLLLFFLRGGNQNLNSVSLYGGTIEPLSLGRGATEDVNAIHVITAVYK